ncbi:tankyrase-1 [Olea europaea var. sylvestris]|uniref:Fetal globin-inducing factor (Contains ankyrin repeats) n=1 Tax=Olea europaea subsp. europaea TaxID=158383 RepID=A0A8S0UH63_OLEEU|nr:tankyrase-1 [Olea europaea var. sylvestris]CAA3017129.1 Fetal globin-inducing factor (contains ankyrin repeats) [Olea europaea subsp. europaea]
MAVSGGRRNGVLGGDEEDAALFEEEGVEFAEEDNIDHSDIPLHLRPLVAAAESGDLNALCQALDNFDGSIDEPVEDGDTVLHLTCLYGHLSCVQFLLERGANLEAKDEDGAIPLHDSCAGGYTQVVQLLLNGANDPERVKRMLQTVDVEGDTPLHHAARGEYDDVIRLLLAHGASPTATNIYGKTPSELTDPGTEARRILEEASSAVSAHS